MLKQILLKLVGAAAAASWFDILKFDIIIGGPAIAITSLWALHFELAYYVHGGLYAKAKQHGR